MIPQFSNSEYFFCLEVWRESGWHFIRNYSSSGWACHRIRKQPNHKYQITKYQITKKHIRTNEIVYQNEIPAQFSYWENAS